jgi:hypothetical protein
MDEFFGADAHLEAAYEDSVSGFYFGDDMSDADVYESRSLAADLEAEFDAEEDPADIAERLS